MTLAPVEAGNPLAVTDYLTKARDWLATAVETTGPEQIALAKAEIATAAEATKQLGLSKEIRDDGTEMVRRAQFTLRRSQKRAQEAGEMRTAADNLVPGGGPRSGGSTTSTPTPRPRDMFASEVEYRDALAMGELEPDEFDDVIAEARAEGNLSRANVAAKSREAAGKPQRATRRRPLPDFARDAADDLLRAVERLERVANDDRFRENRQAISDLAGGRINRSMELLTAFQNDLRNDEATP